MRLCLCTSRTFRRLVRSLKGGINSNWQGYSPLTPNAKIVINKSRKTTQPFFHTPSELKVIACVTCTLWKIACRGYRVIYSNYHTRNMTLSYTSLSGTNIMPQTFYKSAERYFMKVSCRALHHNKKNGHWKGNFAKNRGHASKTHFEEVVMTNPTSCHVHFY